jgi:hypothetical protein
VSNFDTALAQAGELNVDVEHLDNIKEYLEVLARTVREDLKPALEMAHHRAKVGGEGSQSALGSTEINEVMDLSRREDSTYQAMSASLQAFADQLEQMAERMGVMSERYATVEQRNALNNEAFNQALSY